MNATKQFIVNLLDSEVKTELLILFHKNPGLVDTLEGVARRIGRYEEQIRGAVEEFHRVGLLEVKSYGGVTVISLNQERDRELQKTIFDHVNNYFKRRESRQ